MRKVLFTVACIAAIGTALYEAHEASLQFRQVQLLQQTQSALTEQLERADSENRNLSNQLVQAANSSPNNTARLRELLRLRGEVGALRRRQLELEQALATFRAKSPQNEGPPSSASPEPHRPAPFQVQLIADEPGQDTETITNNAGGANGNTLHLNKAPLLDYTAIRSANVVNNANSGLPEINLEFSDEGKELFASVTRDNINKRLAMVLNGEVYAAPVIRSEITGGKAQITGNFSTEEAQALAEKINQAVRFQ